MFGDLSGSVSDRHPLGALGNCVTDGSGVRRPVSGRLLGQIPSRPACTLRLGVEHSNALPPFAVQSFLSLIEFLDAHPPVQCI